MDEKIETIVEEKTERPQIRKVLKDRMEEL